MNYTRQRNDLSGTKITKYATRHDSFVVVTSPGVATIQTRPNILWLPDELREIARFMVSIANDVEAEEEQAARDAQTGASDEA